MTVTEALYNSDMRRLWLTATSDFLKSKTNEKTSEAIVESVFRATAGVQVIGREDIRIGAQMRPALVFDRKHGENP